MNCRFFLAAGLLLCAVSTLAASIDGIWVGQQAGRGGAREDLAFRFKMDGQTLTGKMFGDEFDLPITEGSFSGDQVHFVVTTTNYYSGAKTRFVYTGAIKGDEMELVRERIQTGEDKTGKGPAKQTLKLRRLIARE
jgi:hypothetical protein